MKKSEEGRFTDVKYIPYKLNVSVSFLIYLEKLPFRFNYKVYYPMPFTFSHPAIVLPLKKIAGETLSLTGLIIGSLTPDFEYFIRMSVRSIYSHTVFGLFWFDLPFGLLLTFIYHLVVRDPLISQLPEILNRKLSTFKYFDWLAYFKQNWVIVLVSILIGVASHIFWDDFTHPSGYFVGRFGFLQHKIAFGNVRIPAFTILQHLSSIVGGVIVVFAILGLKTNLTVRSEKRTAYWLSVGSITILIFVIWIFTGLNLHLYGNIVVSFISASLIGVILTSLRPKFAERRDSNIL